jgi:DNA-binding transcriptional MocR family regulator
METDSPRYAAIVKALADDINTGRLKPGDQLPTQRDLADQLGVSIGTVTRAYKAAERRGLVRGEIGRGTFVGGSGPGEFNGADLGIREPGMVDLSVTHPLYSLDPDLGATLRRLSRQPDLQRLLQYQPNQGMRHHREAGAQWVSRLGFDTGPENVLVCAGTQHALTVMLTSIVGRGGSLFVEELTYPGVKALANLLEIKLIPLPVDEGGLVPDSFESACKQRRAQALFTIPTIHNPLTVTMSDSRRREIAGIAVRYNISIFEDAIHHPLADNPPQPLSAYAPENSYLAAAFSKVVTGGLRVAYLVAPPDAVDQLSQAVWATHWMTSPLMAEVAANWIEDGTADAVIQRKKAEARARVNMAREILSGYGMKANDCGYHVWLEIPGAWENAAGFATEARRRGVAVSPADVFATGGNVPNAVRLSLSAPNDRDSLRRGLNKLARLLSETPCCGPPVV